MKDTTAKNILDCLSDLENYPNEALAPYEEFRVGGHTYYFTPGGSLYRKEPGFEKEKACFYGYLPEKVWHYNRRTDDS